MVFFPTDYNVDFYISFDVMMLIDLFTVSFNVESTTITCNVYFAVHLVFSQFVLEHVWETDHVHLSHRKQTEVSMLASTVKLRA